MVGVRDIIHKHSLRGLKNLKIPLSKVKRLMKHIHQVVIKYLTYLILNKQKLDNNQLPVEPPPLKKQNPK